MYGKIFDSMYDGTLHGQWEAIVTMQQLIVLCTPDGIIDMTPQAISSRTSIPLKIITKGLKILAEPDPNSRTPGEEGRRIVLMDDHRPWGWVIVNHEKYQHMQDADTVRAQTRERVRRHREAKKAEKEDVTLVTVGNGSKRHSDSDSDSDSDSKIKSSASPTGSRLQLTELPAEWRAYCTGKRPELDPESVFEDFRDYWKAKPGKDGRKADWPATWRMWVRKERVNGNGKSHTPPWWSSDAAIQAKAAELGMSARAGESWQQLKGRIEEELRRSHH